LKFAHNEIESGGIWGYSTQALTKVKVFSNLEARLLAKKKFNYRLMYGAAHVYIYM